MLYDTSKKWVHYLTRPFNLFGCSLWYCWYADYVRELIGMDVSDVLFVEEHEGVLRHYRVEEQLQYLKDSVKKLAVENPLKCRELLAEAYRLNTIAEDKVALGVSAFENIPDAVSFLFKVAFHSTMLPHFIHLGLTAAQKDDKELLATCEHLRATSFYPAIMQQILVPLGATFLKSQGIADPEKAIQLMTIDELLRKDISGIAPRLEERKNNKKFIFQVVNKKSSLNWISDTSPIVSKLEQVSVEMPQELKGQIAYKGKAKGVARVVLSIDGAGVEFNEGDILVSINSNPHLMHLIKKCSAIVTDEGGLTCHAAIVSRELKKPCIMGTKYATRFLKTGDSVEVDADKGVVRIIK